MRRIDHARLAEAFCSLAFDAVVFGLANLQKVFAVVGARRGANDRKRRRSLAEAAEVERADRAETELGLGVDQGGEALGPTVGRMRSPGVEPVVSPVALAREEG